MSSSDTYRVKIEHDTPDVIGEACTTACIFGLVIAACFIEYSVRQNCKAAMRIADVMERWEEREIEARP